MDNFTAAIIQFKSRYIIVTNSVHFFLYEIENLKVTTSCAVFHFHLVAVYYLIYARPVVRYGYLMFLAFLITLVSGPGE